MKRHANKFKPGRKSEAKKASDKTALIEPAVPLSAGRKWLFRFIALVVLPLLLLGVVEAGLRLAGYGYPTGFFKKIRIADKNYFINNENFTLRFFPPQLARWPDPFLFQATKPPDTVRIFIFGESAAMGDPQPAYGASRYMEVLLRQRFPGKKFEVINLGITAINSHVILPIARECARHDGDFWIIYMGNNEMVGPFGAATVFGAQALPLSLVRFNLTLQQTRTGQWLVSAMRHLAGKSKNTSWGGMEMFLENQIPPDDPRKETVYRNFAANLRDIISAGMNSGAKVILNTVAVNLKDSPPFASLNNSNLPAADRQQFDRLFAEAKSLQSQSNYLAAAELFTQTVKLDPQYAEAHYRLAQCERALTNAGAPEQFQIACDMDALPFRTDTRINHAIRQLAQADAGDRMTLCDAEQSLARSSPAHIPGDEVFYEHVHFNFDGNYRLGKMWAEQISRQLASGGSPTGTTNWASQADCDHALGLSIWNRQFVLQSMMHRFSTPPFNSQFNNTERLQKLSAEELSLRKQQTQPGAVQSVREEFAVALQHAPADAYLYEGLANFREAINDPQEAIEAYRHLSELRPDDFYACLQLGRLLGEHGQPAQGEPPLKRATQLRPSLANGWFELGDIHLAIENFESALRDYNVARQLDPHNGAYCAYAGKALSKLNRHAEAVQLYRQAIQLQPDLWEAHLALGDDLAGLNQFSEAEKEYSEVIRLRPAIALAHLNRGVMLAQLGRLDEALMEFQAAMRLEPDNQKAREYFQRIQDWGKNQH